MLAAVPGCGTCVSASERGFEPSSSKLTWGEAKHNPTAGPAPHETAEDAASALPETTLKCCEAGVLLVGSSAR